MNVTALLTALATLAMVVTGACVTSEQTTGAMLDVHLALSVLVTVLLIALTITVRKDRMALRVSLAALGVLIVEGGLGHSASIPWVSVLHATLAPILLALTAVAGVCTSKSWKAGPEPCIDCGWPSLRSLAIMTPALVLIQVVLGACFRHKTMGLTWHIIGAMVVSLAILLFGMFVNQQFPKHSALKPWAVSMLVVALTQVLLGVAAITALMVAPDNVVTINVVVSTVAHVSVGALTLATALILAIQVRRNVQKAAEEPEEEGSAAASS